MAKTIIREEAVAIAKEFANYTRVELDGAARVCLFLRVEERLTTAFTIFATKVSKEKRIPFEIVADPFYAQSNMDRLKKAVADVESGKAKLTEHELIEVEDG